MKKSIEKMPFDRDYCAICPLRVREFAGTKPTNKGPNCPAGRENNPRSAIATLNVVRAGGEICSFNPTRRMLGLKALRMKATEAK